LKIASSIFRQLGTKCGHFMACYRFE